LKEREKKTIVHNRTDERKKELIYLLMIAEGKRTACK